MQATNYYAYGSRRMWKALRRAGESLAHAAMDSLSAGLPLEVAGSTIEIFKEMGVSAVAMPGGLKAGKIVALPLPNSVEHVGAPDA